MLVVGYDMYWVEPADPEVLAQYEDLREQWEAAVVARDRIPKDEHGNFTREEFDAGAVWEGAGIPANASERYRAAQEHQHQLYEAMSAADVWYHRRNVWGMGILRDVMLRLDMVRSNYSMDECPFPWPEASWKDDPDEGEHWDAFYDWSSNDWSLQEAAEYERDHPNLMNAFREYREVKNRRLTWVPEECFKIMVDGEEVIDETPHAIPIHKFGSNDDWIVTPTECTAALTKARSASDRAIRLAFQVSGATDWDPADIARSWQSWLTFIEGAASHGGFSVR